MSTFGATSAADGYSGSADPMTYVSSITALGPYPQFVAILVDPPVWPYRDRLWSHLVSDVSYAELHDFAGRLGLPQRAFHRDHYDLPAERHAAAVELGASPVSGREVLAALRRAGLRRPAPRLPRPGRLNPVGEG